MKFRIVIVIALAFCYINGFSQTKLEEIENSINDNITLTDTSGNIHASLLSDNTSIPKVSFLKNYYWFSLNKIFVTQGGFNGRLLHGEYTSFYKSNQIKEKGTFSNGLKVGEWLEWYPNGLIKSRYSWKKGLLQGKFYEYDTNGVLLKSGKYKRGKLKG